MIEQSGEIWCTFTFIFPNALKYYITLVIYHKLYYLSYNVMDKTHVKIKLTNECVKNFTLM